MEDDIRIFLNNMKSTCPGLSNPELDCFAKGLETKILKKKDFFIPSGQIQKEVGFITRGLIRSFFIDNNSNEKTVRFYAENDYATH